MKFEDSVKNYISVNEKISQNFKSNHTAQLPLPVVEKIELDDTQPDLKKVVKKKAQPQTKFSAIDFSDKNKNKDKNFISQKP